MTWGPEALWPPILCHSLAALQTLQASVASKASLSLLIMSSVSSQIVECQIPASVCELCAAAKCQPPNICSSAAAGPSLSRSECELAALSDFLKSHQRKREGTSRKICAFNIQGLEAPFEAVVLNGTSGEGQLRARGLVDCELQKEYTFIIQAHDCGSGPEGTEVKKSHK
ncbi:hypothetical protein NQZ68_015729 [Dissostichus eleginoides]|nr:hypothetical protein NQZ68_015729 [Dissostichus eleginoides]